MYVLRVFQPCSCLQSLWFCPLEAGSVPLRSTHPSWCSLLDIFKGIDILPLVWRPHSSTILQVGSDDSSKHFLLSVFLNLRTHDTIFMHMKQPRPGEYFSTKRVQQLCIWSRLASKVQKDGQCRSVVATLQYTWVTSTTILVCPSCISVNKECDQIGWSRRLIWLHSWQFYNNYTTKEQMTV